MQVISNMFVQARCYVCYESKYNLWYSLSRCKKYHRDGICDACIDALKKRDFYGTYVHCPICRKLSNYDLIWKQRYSDCYFWATAIAAISEGVSMAIKCVYNWVTSA